MMELRSGNVQTRLLAQRLSSLLSAGVTHLPKPRLESAARSELAAVQPPALGPLAAVSWAAGPEQGAPSEHAAASIPPAALASDNTPSVTVAAAAPPSQTSGAPRLAPPPAASLFEIPEPALASVPRLTREERIVALEALKRQVEPCQRCASLLGRTQTVFGSGNVEPRLVFVGEAPGADEDRLGEPFVGRAGQKLTEIIENGMRISRADVYICNVLKCRPPGNRTPEPDEIEHCRGFLERQLEILQPEWICCLGGTASKTLLRTTLSMARLRGKVLRYQGTPVVCTYHPSYILKYPEYRKDVWEDIQMLMREMGLSR